MAYGCSGKQVRKAVPNAVDIIITPLITVLVVSIVTMLAIQPVAGFLSEGITSGINGILSIGGAFAEQYLQEHFTARYGRITSRFNTDSYGVY